jgi:hypothetical protein
MMGAIPDAHGIVTDHDGLAMYGDFRKVAKPRELLGHVANLFVVITPLVMTSPSVVSEATAEEKLVASSESARSLLIQRLEGSRPAVRSGAGGYGFSMGSMGGMR